MIDLRPVLKRYRVAATGPISSESSTEPLFWVPPPSPQGERSMAALFVPPPSPGPVTQTPKAPRTLFVPPPLDEVTAERRATSQGTLKEFFVPPLSPSPLPSRNDGKPSKRPLFIPPESPMLSASRQSDNITASKLRSTSAAMTGLSLVDRESCKVDHGGELFLSNTLHFK